MDRAPEPEVASPPERELTVRALVFGVVMGGLLAAGNVYTMLKTTFIDGGGITTALVGFAFFTTFRRLSSRPYGALENNIATTTASSAAIMGFAIGFPGAIPALELMGHHYPGWALAVWGIALGTVGIVLAGFLRRKLVLNERLPFPTGTATAEVIDTISASRQTAMHRARLLVGAALGAALFAWFRDGRPSLIPQMSTVGGMVAGASLSGLGVGVSWQPMLAAIGVLIGFRNALSMLVGAVVAWIVLAPWLANHGVIATATYAGASSWLIWPGLGLLVASSFVPLVMDWRALARSFRDIPALFRRRAADALTSLPSDRFRLATPLLLVSVVLMLVVGRVAFHLSPVVTLIGLVIALVLANVCARTAGETDMAPTGAMGTLTQLMFTGSGPVASLIAGSISAGTATQASQTLWAFKAGDKLRSSANAQMWAQLLGATVGALVCVPVYFVITQAWGIGTVAIPAPSALSWKATAEAVGGGLAAMPPYAFVAGTIGFCVGVLLTALGGTRLGRFLPSPAAMGIAIISPFSISMSAFVGGLAVVVVKRVFPKASDAAIMSVAAGGIAGESVMGVIVAALIATGIL
jgi:putative OPT family oligopeptide transporter